MQLFDLTISWIPRIEALLLCLLLLISAIQPKAILLSLQAISSPIQRRYDLGGNNVIMIVLRSIFQLGTTALTLTIVTASWLGHTDWITGSNYLIAVGILLGVMLIKALVDKWIQLTFQYELNEQTYYSYRSELWQVTSLVLWVIIMLQPRLSLQVLWIAALITLGLYYITLWWKIMQTFGWSVVHGGYTTLYILHAEVLPLAVATGVIGEVMK